MNYEMSIKILGIKLFKEQCKDYINRHQLRPYGYGQFIIDQPIGKENQNKLLQYLDTKYNLILHQKTTTTFIMRFKNNK
jgi:hypothetical protein